MVFRGVCLQINAVFFYVPERPGMMTPLAPWIWVMTPWAETDATRVERTYEYFIFDALCVNGLCQRVTELKDTEELQRRTAQD
jgi:hypothetical protein